MFLTGFADEAARDIDGQIKAIKDLGWSHIELRAVNGQNIHDISDEEFDYVEQQLRANEITVNAFGSTICNWGKSILDPFESSLDEMERCIPRMHRLGTKYVRIMSFGVLADRDPDEQLLDERVRRLRIVVDRFKQEGLEALHENCANYGGMGAPFTLKLLEQIPGLRLIFDTANPPTTLDRSKPKPYAPQSAWEFYDLVKEHIAHVHIKDARFIKAVEGQVFEDADYVYPGEGEGDVKRIVKHLLNNGYDGGFSMEPHLSVVFHDDSVASSEEAMYQSFVKYGRRFETLLSQLG